MTGYDAPRPVRAPKLQQLDPHLIKDLDSPVWKRRKTLLHVSQSGMETKIRIRRSSLPSELGDMRISEIECVFETDGRIVGFCEMATFGGAPISIPAEYYWEMDDHSLDAQKLNLLLQTRFSEDILDYGDIVLLERIQFLPSCTAGAWIGPFDHVVDRLFSADRWGFLIGKAFPLEYESHQHDVDVHYDFAALELRQEALARLYARRLGFQRLPDKANDWVWRPIGPRCTVSMIGKLICPPEQARPLANPAASHEPEQDGDASNDFAPGP